MGVRADSNRTSLSTNLTDYRLPVPDALVLSLGYLLLAFGGNNRFLEARHLSVIGNGDCTVACSVLLLSLGNMKA